MLRERFVARSLLIGLAEVSLLFVLFLSTASHPSLQLAHHAAQSEGMRPYYLFLLIISALPLVLSPSNQTIDSLYAQNRDCLYSALVSWMYCLGIWSLIVFVFIFLFQTHVHFYDAIIILELLCLCRW